MNSISNAIEEYRSALEENVEASRAEISARRRKEKAYYTLLRAKENLRAIERETLEQVVE